LDRDRGVFRLPEGCEPGARYVELGEALLAALLDGREFESAPTEACQIFWVLDAVLVAGSDFSFLRALRGRQASFEEDSELFEGMATGVALGIPALVLLVKSSRPRVDYQPYSEEKAQAAGFYVGFGSAGAPAGLSLGARF
jgi:hypothetical protein